jgi:hypothetical protein
LPEHIARNRDAISTIVEKELPAFLFKLEGRERPEAYDRVGRLKCFWNPQILGDLNELSNEYQLLQLIKMEEEASPDNFNKPMYAAEVEALITGQYAKNPHGARKLLSWSKACGTYLSNLAKDPESGVVARGMYKGIMRYEFALQCEDEELGGGEKESISLIQR